MLQRFQVLADFFRREAIVSCHLDGEGHEGSLLHAQRAVVRRRVLGYEHVWVEGVPFPPVVDVNKGFIGVGGARGNVDFCVNRPLSARWNGGSSAWSEIGIAAEMVILVGGTGVGNCFGAGCHCCCGGRGGTEDLLVAFGRDRWLIQGIDIKRSSLVVALREGRES